MPRDALVGVGGKRDSRSEIPGSDVTGGHPRLFCFVDLQFGKLLSNLFSMTVEFDIFLNREQFAIFADEKSPTLGKRSVVVNHTEHSCRVPLGITQDRVIQFQRLGEILVLLFTITAGCKVGDVKFAKGRTALTERFALQRSATGERFWVPGDHDRLLTLEVGKLVCLSIASL